MVGVPFWRSGEAEGRGCPTENHTAVKATLRSQSSLAAGLAREGWENRGPTEQDLHHNGDNIQKYKGTHTL